MKKRIVNKGIAKKTAHHSIRGVVAVLAAFALFVTVMHFAAHRLQTRQAFIEQELDRHTGLRLQAEQIKTGWTGLTPYIVLRQVTVTPTTTAEQANQPPIDRMTLSFSLWSVLWYKSLTPDRIDIRGGTLKANITATGKMTINGISWPRFDLSASSACPKPDDEQSLTHTDLSDWRQCIVDVTARLKTKRQTTQKSGFFDRFPQQSEICVVGTRLQIRFGTHHPQTLVIENGCLYRTWNGHELTLAVRRQQQPTGTAAIRITTHEDSNEAQKLRADIDIGLHHIDAAHWPLPIVHDLRLTNGKLDGSVRLTWRQGQWQTAQADIQARALRLLSVITDQVVPLRQLRLSGMWQRIGQGWQLFAPQLRFATDRFRSKNLVLFLRRQSHVLQLSLNRVDLAAANALLSDSGLLSPTWHHRLRQQRPTGLLRHIKLVRQLNDATKNTATRPFENVSMQLQNVSFNEDGNLPGMRNLSGTLQAEAHQGHFTLDSSDLIANVPHRLQVPVYFKTAQAVIDWSQQSDGGWRVTADAVALQNADMQLHGNMALSIPAQDHGNPFVKLQCRFQEKRAALLAQYIPQFNFGVIPWLDRAFVGGGAIDGRLVWYGVFKQFPYRDQAGLFSIDANLHRVTLHYANGWPTIQATDAKLTIHNRRLQITNGSGKIYNTPLKQVTADIADIHPDKNASPQLIVQGRLDSQGKDIARFIDNSPLQKNLGELTRKITLHGKIDLQMALHIPLKRPNATTLAGKATLYDNTLTAPDWNVRLLHLQGQSDFTRRTLDSHRLTAQWLGHHVSGAIHAAEDKQGATVRLNGIGKLPIKTLEQYLQLPHVSFINGTAQYRMQAMLYPASHDMRPDTLDVQSDWRGVTVSLPELLGKPPTQKTNFHIRMQAEPQAALSVTGRYNAALSWALLFRQNAEKELKLFSSDINFGDLNAVLQQQPGLAVTGTIPKLDWQEWRDYVRELRANRDEVTASGLRPRTADIKIGELTFFERKFSPITLRAQAYDDQYHIKLDGPQAAGTITLSRKLPPKHIAAHFNYLYLQAAHYRPPANSLESHKTLTRFFATPADVPALDIHIDDLRHQGADFGRVSLSTEHQGDDTLKLKQFDIDSPILTGQVIGVWRQQSKTAQQMQLKGALSSQRLTALLALLHVHSSLHANRGQTDFNLNWQGTPYHINLKTLAGNASVNLEDGYVNVANGSTENTIGFGKLLNALSIGNILSGFQMFQHNGYPFRSLQSIIGFNRGTLSLNSLSADGSVADMDASGKVNMLNNKINLDLFIKPHLTSSVPVVAGLATLNPIVGLFTWVADKFVGKGISKAAGHHYRVTGTLKHPHIVRQTRRR